MCSLCRNLYSLSENISSKITPLKDTPLCYLSAMFIDHYFYNVEADNISVIILHIYDSILSKG